MQKSVRTLATAFAASICSMSLLCAPGHAQRSRVPISNGPNHFHNVPITGVETPFACAGDSGGTATSEFVPILYNRHRTKFISASTVDATDDDANSAAAGATIDGIDGIPFRSISVDVSNDALVDNPGKGGDLASRFRIRVIGGDVDNNFVSVLVHGDDVTPQNLGNGFSRFFLTPSTANTDLDEVVDMTRFYIFVRPGKQFPNLSVKFGNVLLNGVSPVFSPLNAPCPKDFD